MAQHGLYPGLTEAARRQQKQEENLQLCLRRAGSPHMPLALLYLTSRRAAG